MYCVINVHRPLSANVESILDMIRSIELNSRLKITHLINNSNISYGTTIKDVLNGQDIIEGVSKECGKPIEYISGMGDILSSLPKDLLNKAFPLDIFMRPIWDQ